MVREIKAKTETIKLCFKVKGVDFEWGGGQRMWMTGDDGPCRKPVIFLSAKACGSISTAGGVCRIQLKFNIKHLKRFTFGCLFYKIRSV